jgi:hypothetical protein
MSHASRRVAVGLRRLGRKEFGFHAIWTDTTMYNCARVEGNVPRSLRRPRPWNASLLGQSGSWWQLRMHDTEEQPCMAYLTFSCTVQVYIKDGTAHSRRELGARLLRDPCSSWVWQTDRTCLFEERCRSKSTKFSLVLNCSLLCVSLPTCCDP